MAVDVVPAEGSEILLSYHSPDDNELDNCLVEHHRYYDDRFVWEWKLSPCYY